MINVTSSSSSCDNISVHEFFPKSVVVMYFAHTSLSFGFLVKSSRRSKYSELKQNNTVIGGE